MSDDDTRWVKKSARVKRGDEARAIADWQSRGWEHTGVRHGRRSTLTFQREGTDKRWALKLTTGGLALLLIVGLVTAVTTRSGEDDPLARVRTDAATAVRALNDADLPALDTILARHRGQTDFAYFFTSKATPRALGDALATVAGDDRSTPFKEDLDTHAYDITLTDLAGTLALATHGTGSRALPASWTDDFVKATTAPEALYGGTGESTARRARQDLANKQNLLLLLSRGYWSTDFLKATTKAYWEVDHDKGANAWLVDSLNDAKYAPSPGGAYLTDGVVALAAALTTNPAASQWAFTDFRSGTQTIDGSDRSIGRFAHFLFFEHRFPRASKSDVDSVGMTVALTALSSAIDATGAGENVVDALDREGPAADSIVLQDLAKEATTTSDGSIVAKAWDATKNVAETVWNWAQKWGHAALGILSLTAYAPPPFKAVGVLSASANATWYVIDGDYAEAGLSLAAVVPGLGFSKIAKVVRAGGPARKAAKESDEIARITRKSTGLQQRVTSPYLKNRQTPRVATKAKIEADAPKTANGDFIDPNTGKVIPREGPYAYGHKPGYEYRCVRDKALALGWTRQQFLDYYNNPDHFQIEDPISNRSHQYESKICAK